MIKYTKIETIFERDTEGTKKLIEGKFIQNTATLKKPKPPNFVIIDTLSPKSTKT